MVAVATKHTRLLYTQQLFCLSHLLIRRYEILLIAYLILSCLYLIYLISDRLSFVIPLEVCSV